MAKIWLVRRIKEVTKRAKKSGNYTDLECKLIKTFMLLLLALYHEDQYWRKLRIGRNWVNVSFTRCSRCWGMYQAKGKNVSLWVESIPSSRGGVGMKIYNARQEVKSEIRINIRTCYLYYYENKR